jgi:hypothetical protein
MIKAVKVLVICVLLFFALWCLLGCMVLQTGYFNVKPSTADNIESWLCFGLFIALVVAAVNVWRYGNPPAKKR